MKYNAHDYQKFASDFILSHPACCLMLDMGLGKTVITLTALWDLLLDQFEVGRVLIIAPKRVAETTWPQEIEKWEHLKGITYSVVLGTDASHPFYGPYQTLLNFSFSHILSTDFRMLTKHRHMLRSLRDSF